MNDRLKFEKRLLYGILTLFFVLFGFMFIKLNNVHTQLDDVKTEMVKQNSLIMNEINSQKSLLRPVVDIENNSIVIPEAGIKLPYNDITKTFQYSYDSGEYGYLRVTSTLISDNIERQLSCSELALISFSNGSAINPWTEASGSVKLSDSRILFIISPIAYENNEASTTACETEVWTTISPKVVAEEFKKAVSL